MKGKRYKQRRQVAGVYLVDIVLALIIFAIGVAMGFLMGRYPEQEAEPVQAVEPVVATDRQATSKLAAEPIVVVAEIATTTEEPVVAEPAKPEPTYTEEDLEMLALVIYQEAGGDACSDECRQMVGEVALNRVADSRYPDTLYEVLTQKAQYGRLHWTGLVWPERVDNPGEAHAVERAYQCAEALLAGTAERLLPEDVIFQAEFTQGTETVAAMDGFYFCR